VETEGVINTACRMFLNTLNVNNFGGLNLKYIETGFVVNTH